MNASAYELNLDGLVGPTHNYAGLSYGNLASQRSKRSVSNPRAAALEGLRKMKFLADLGVRQAVLPPQERPDIRMLRRLGFAGSDAQVIESAYRSDPALLAACYSASSMWAANAATVSPSGDTADGRVHFTSANLVTQFHRSLETEMTSRLLATIFPDESVFAHHRPLPPTLHFSDEGAANHMRLCGEHGGRGVEIFVYGRSGFGQAAAPTKYPARQSLEASRGVARLHGLDLSRTLFIQQSPQAIDAGAFHNDVVAVANEQVLLCHELAYPEPNAIGSIREVFARTTGRELSVIEVGEDEVPLGEAVESYLFNSQIVSLPDGSMSLVYPAECERFASTREFVSRLVGSAHSPIRSAHCVDVRQSMRNGGGPACLRLRVVLTEAQSARMRQSVLLTDELHAKLTDWVVRHYRERLEPADLADPQLVEQSRAALDELSGVLGLGSIYGFQCADEDWGASRNLASEL